jgi:hypothetical protein
MTNEEIIEQLKNIYLDFETTKNDENIIETCIDGLSTEKDFFYATKMLFNRTKNKTLKVFKNKSVFIKFRDMQKDIFPSWINDLTKEDQEALKDTYRDIICHCFFEHEYYRCKHHDLLQTIQDVHKKAVPYWLILAVIQENINVVQPIPKDKLIEFMANGEYFIDLCRERYKKRQEFLKNFKGIESIGEKI